MKYAIEKITSDNIRPGMKLPNGYPIGYIIRFNYHDTFGWLGLKIVETEDDAKAFAASLQEPTQ